MIPLSATPIGANRCQFIVWAPEKEKMTLVLVAPRKEQILMQQDEYGYWKVEVDDVAAGARYFFLPENDENHYPDPASHYQPEGVHGPSEVVDHSHFEWTDASWRGLPLKDLVLYELHVGTFTAEGNFEAIISKLDELLDTGINAIELMPVNAFPGNRNWGYDGVYPYAVQESYGGPEGLKKLVDACHRKGMAVFLDVVYNHLGPEGNYFSQYGPYFTTNYHTPWGDALNFDTEWSDGVRQFFTDNPLHWFENYHIDGLRLDAIHAVHDEGAVHVWELMHEKVRLLEQKLGRTLYLTAESDLNSPRVIKNPENGGWGFNAQWLDDFHHSLYVMLDDKGRKLYEDFGQMEQLAKAYTDGFVHSGEYVKFRKRKHGAPSVGIPGDRFVVFNQNHDQVGNRVRGERLSVLVDFERLKLGAAALLLSPYVPMLFMGEEYAEEAPFYYFVSHSEEALIKAVREGRKKEFEAFNWNVEPPDPQSEKTFEDARLQWHKRNEGKHEIILGWHKELIHLRRTHPVLQNFVKNDVRALVISNEGLVLHRQSNDGRQHLFCILNFSDEALEYAMPDYAKAWNKLIDSTEPRWAETGLALGEPLPSAVSAGTAVCLKGCGVVVYEGGA